MLAIAHVHIADDVYDPAVGFFRKAFVEASVACFHVEDRDVETLGSDDAEAAVGVAKDKHCIWLYLHHELVALVDDVAHGGAKVFAYSVEIHLWISELEVAEEYSIEVVVVVLACMCKYGIEVLATFAYHCCKADNFRPCTHNNQKLQLSIFLPMYIAVIIHFMLHINLLPIYFL